MFIEIFSVVIFNEIKYLFIFTETLHYVLFVRRANQ